MLTIVTPATSSDLTTLRAIKSELPDSSTSEDGRLLDYISQASDAIASYCNRVFAREEVEETFRVSHMQGSLSLTRFPVSSVSTIVENDEELTTDDYEIDPDAGTLRRLRNGESSLLCRGKIVVTYTAGFVLPGLTTRNLPRDIERAAIMLVVHYYSTDLQSQFIRREAIEGLGSSERFAPSSSGLPTEVEALISRYKQVAL